MELVKGGCLFHSMVGSHYKSMLFDDLTKGEEWFMKLLTKRKRTPESDCYYTFVSHGIFKRFRDEMYERMYNKKK